MKLLKGNFLRRMLATTLAVGLVGLVAGTETPDAAHATFSGTNGPLLYASYNIQTRMMSLKASTLTGTEVAHTLTATEKPKFSADATKVVWGENSGQGWVIKMSRADGTNVITVASGSSSPAATSPSFSPDGTKIAVSYDNDLHIVDAAASQTFSSSNRIIDSSGVGISVRQPQYVSATKIAYVGEQPGHTCGSGYAGIYIKDLTVSGVGTVLTNSCNNSPNRTYATNLDVSPDGQYVIFRFEATNSSIAITKTDNTGSKIAVHNGTSYSDAASGTPVFSPDGTKILFNSSSKLKVADFDGTTVGTATEVPFPQGVFAPSDLTWAPLEASINAGSSPSSPNSGSSSTSQTSPTPTSSSVVPGVTVTDPMVYRTAPKEVASGSAITVLSPAQAKTQIIETSTPGVCVPTEDDIVFIDEGRCNATVLNKRTGKILRKIRTTVVEDDVVELGVGNEIVTLAPIYFTNGSSVLTKAARARVAELRSNISTAGTVMVIGHSGMMLGDTPENKALSRSRAINTVREMKRAGATGPFYSVGVGAADPEVKSTSRKNQDKNRRVVIVLIP